MVAVRLRECVAIARQYPGHRSCGLIAEAHTTEVVTDAIGRRTLLGGFGQRLGKGWMNEHRLDDVGHPQVTGHGHGEDGDQF